MEAPNRINGESERDIVGEIVPSRRGHPQLWAAGTRHYASSGITKAWKTRFHRRSPAYTTDWDALPVITV